MSKRSGFILLPFILSSLSFCTYGAGTTDLVDIYKLAEKHDVLIRQQRELYFAAKQDKYIERAALLPQVDLSASIGTQRVDHINVPFRFDYYGYEILLDQVIFDWEKWQKYLRTKPMITVAEKNLYIQNQNLILRTSQAYLNILLAQDLLDFKEKEYVAVSEFKDETQARFDLGELPISDLEQVKANLDAINADLYAAKNMVENNKEVLREIISVPVPNNLARLRAKTVLPNTSPGTVQQWLDLALRYNLDLHIAQANCQIARHNIGIAESGYLPTVNLSGRLRGNNRNRAFDLGAPAGTPAKREFINTAGVTLEIRSPNLNPYGSIAENAKARYDFHKTDQEFVETYRNTKMFIEQIFRDAKSTKAQVDALKQSVISSQIALDSTRENYELGMRTYVFVLNRISDVFKAKRDYKEAVYKHILAILRLEAAAGRLDIKDLFAVNKLLDKYEAPKKNNKSSTAVKNPIPTKNPVKSS